jgi:hypothetical protein
MLEQTALGTEKSGRAQSFFAFFGGASASFPESKYLQRHGSRGEGVAWTALCKKDKKLSILHKSG